MAQLGHDRHQHPGYYQTQTQPPPYPQQKSEAVFGPVDAVQKSRRRGLDPTALEYVPEGSPADVRLSTHPQMLAEVHDDDNNGKKPRTNSVGADSVQTIVTVKTNPLFWSPNPRVLNPKARSWKSPSTKLNSDWQRTKKLVTHVAPEQFCSMARPTSSPCEIMPTSYQEYLEHLRDVSRMAAEQVEKNIAGMNDQIKMFESQGRIVSIFGKGGKEFEAGFSPVLCHPTVFSSEFKKLGLPQARWPPQSELQFDGDNREQHATRYGRFLPPPRMPTVNDVPFYAKPLMPILPFDQTGPIYVHGPTPIAVAAANEDTDQDREFEQAGRLWLGEELMKEIGPRTEPFVPDWLKRLKNAQ